MGRIEKKKKLIIERANRKMLGESEMDCPKAAKDLELNTKNRNSAIKAEHIKYGPLNVDEPGDYWKDLAEHWDTTEEAAKKLRDRFGAKTEGAKPPGQEDLSSPPDKVTQETNRNPETGESTSSGDPAAPLSTTETNPVTQAIGDVKDIAGTTEANLVKPEATTAQEATLTDAGDIGETLTGNAKVISDFRAAANQPDLVNEPFSAPRTLEQTVVKNTPIQNNVSTDLHTNPTSADVQKSGASVEDMSNAENAIKGTSELGPSIEEGANIASDAAGGILSTAGEIGSMALDAIPVVGEVAMLGSLLASFFSGASEKKAEAKVPEPTEPPEAPQIVGAGYDVR